MDAGRQEADAEEDEAGSPEEAADEEEAGRRPEKKGNRKAEGTARRLGCCATTWYASKRRFLFDFHNKCIENI